jgi:RHS repeat-associated protein
MKTFLIASKASILAGKFVLLSMLSVLLIYTTAKGQGSTDGATPLGLAPGSAAGSYALSDFDVVSLYNGGLNFRLPLYQIAGRGGAGYPITLHVQKKWTVHKHLEPGVGAFWFADAGWWSEEGAGLKIFSAGKVDIRSAWREQPTGFPVETLTRITFTSPDGTEYELRDQLTNGQPVSPVSGGFSRGTIFVTADGSSATFVSDWNIHDDPTFGQGFYDNRPDGYLVLRDGTRFRLDDGKISWMRDRNGNKVSFTYDPFRRVTSITDSLNRLVTISYPSQATGFTQISYKGFGGAARTIKIGQTGVSNALRSDYTMQTIGQLFPELNGGGPVDSIVVNYIELPDGRSYQLRYNPYGELARVVLPTGGAIEYDYAAGLSDGAASGVFVVSDPHTSKYIYRRVIERRIYPLGGTGSVYQSKTTYSRPETTGGNLGYVVTETRNANGTLLAKSQHYFNGSPKASFSQKPTHYSAWKDGQEYKTEIFDTNGSTVLRRVEHTFAQRALVSWWGGLSDEAPPNDPRITQTVTTVDPNGPNLVSKQTFGFDDTVPFNNQNNLKEYNFGSGAAGSLARETRTTFVTSSSYTDNAVHLRSLPSQVSIHDGGGVERASTTYEYDNYATNANHAALTNRSNISGFDTAFNTSYTTRGNATATTRYLLVSGSITGSISTYTQYDIAGNVVKTIDAGGNAATFLYSDCFGAPNGEAETSTDPTELGATTKTFAFATEVRNSLNQSTFVQFDYYLGQAVDAKDVNGVLASGYFNDSLDRTTDVRRAVGTTLENRTVYSYDDTNRITTTTNDRDSNADGILISKLLYDQLGRTIETRQYEGGTNYIATQTQYDALGKPFKNSNPFRPWQSESALWTTQTFDALGRVISVTTPDSAVVATSYSGNSVTATDQTGKQRKSVTDSLDRVIQVYEAPNDANFNYLTSYAYDTLDNLTTVTQGSQTRTFVYDSLTRLTSATNPENGTTTYQYDNNGNLLVKTDGRAVSTHIAYDALNRITRRWYNGSSSVSATTHNSPSLPSGVGARDEAKFYYDSQTLPVGAPSYSRGAAVGHLVAQTYGASANGDYYAYDALGMSTLKIQRTGTVNYQLSATYNLSGAPTSITYPSGHTVSNTYDAAGRLVSFSGNLGDGTTRAYATGILYSPTGGLVKEQFGTTTPVYNKLFYNVRGQLAEIRASTSYTGPTDTTWDRGAIINSYSNQCTGVCSGSSMTDNNGNLLKQQIYIPGQTMRWQQYDYDSLNRLNWAREVLEGGAEQWKQQYTYDRWGNRTINTAITYGTGINNKAFTVNTSNNRLGVPVGQSGVMTYDAAGNLTNDTYTGAGNRTYDVENKITSAWGGNNQAQLYSYDAAGQRIKRTVNGLETWHVYGLGGELIAEYAANGAATNPQKEFGYRNGQLLITAEGRTNVALSANGGVASASSAHTCCGFSVGGAINGNVRGPWSNGEGWNDATENVLPDWFQVDFAGSKTIDEIDVFSLHDNYTEQNTPTETQTFTLHGLVNFQVQYWNGSAWTTIPGGNVTGNNKVWRKFAFAPITTSKIRLWITGVPDSWSRLVELQAWAADTGVTNLALNKPASQSSTDWSAPASRGVDGNTDGNFWNNSVTHTATQSQPWWQVDLQSVANIQNINVWNRTDCCGEALSNFYVFVSDNPFTANDVASTQSQPGVSTYFIAGQSGVPSTIGVNRTGRYVRVQLGNTERLSVAEVQVFGGGGNPQVRWLLTDQLGTPRMIVDQSGSLATMKRHDYLPYGEELFAPTGGRTTTQGYAAGDGLRQQFTSKERDAETGLDYFSARYYSSIQARFVSPDIFSGDKYDPQSLNLYTYVLNNPLNLTDSTGYSPDPELDRRYFGKFQDRKNQDPHKSDIPPAAQAGDPYPTAQCAGCGSEFGVVANITVPYALVHHSPIATTTEPVLAAFPTLKPSVLDYVPVVGSAREFLFNYNTHNFEGALLSFGKLAIELTPVGVLARTGKAASVGVRVVPEAAEAAARAATPVVREAAITVNGRVGNAFRDEIATLLERAGFTVKKEVYKHTPFGGRRVDIEVWKNGERLGGIETKWGKSPYHAAQRAKDWYLRKYKNFTTNVIRGPF